MAIDLKFLEMTVEKKVVPRHTLGYAGHVKFKDLLFSHYCLYIDHLSQFCHSQSKFLEDLKWFKDVLSLCLFVSIDSSVQPA